VVAVSFAPWDGTRTVRPVEASMRIAEICSHDVAGVEAEASVRKAGAVETRS